MQNKLKYKIIDDILLIENKLNTLLFDSSSLILSTVEKKDDFHEAITVFKNYKKKLQKICKNADQKDLTQQTAEKLTICLLISNDCNLSC